MLKNISIITNWGCRANCWYCVWKGHPCENVQLETDWKKFEIFITKNRRDKISVSGGGDCLYKYDLHKDWWDRLFALCGKYNMKIDVHTRERFCRDYFWERINRCVISSDLFRDDISYFEYLRIHTKLRVTHVITANSTFANAEAYINYCEAHECQLTFKELTGHDDKGKYQIFKKKYHGKYFLDSGDYNLYFFPNNTIQNNFMQPGVR